MELQYVFGASSMMQLVNVLGDDYYRAPLLAETSLAFGYSQVSCIRLLTAHYLQREICVIMIMHEQKNHPYVTCINRVTE